MPEAEVAKATASPRDPRAVPHLARGASPRTAGVGTEERAMVGPPTLATSLQRPSPADVGEGAMQVPPHPGPRGKKQTLPHPSLCRGVTEADAGQCTDGQVHRPSLRRKEDCSRTN